MWCVGCVGVWVCVWGGGVVGVWVCLFFGNFEKVVFVVKLAFKLIHFRNNVFSFYFCFSKNTTSELKAKN